jgi:hypothetical protein
MRTCANFTSNRRIVVFVWLLNANKNKVEIKMVLNFDVRGKKTRCSHLFVIAILANGC